MGAYEDLVRETVEAVLERGRPLTVMQLAHEVDRRVIRVAGLEVTAPSPTVVELVLREDPARFLEVAPGVWARRGDGPEAGVPGRRRRPPFSGSAAAAASPPEVRSDVDAVGGAGSKASPAGR